MYKLETVGLRFFTVYGPWGRPDMALFKFVNNIIKNKAIEIFNYGNHSRDFTYIDDIVDGIILLTKSKKIFNIINRKKKKIFLQIQVIISFLKFLISEVEKTSLMKYINIIEKKFKNNAKKNIYHYKKVILKVLCQILQSLKKLVINQKLIQKYGIRKFVKWYKINIKFK